MDNDTLMIMCLVCTQIRDIIWTGQGMETKLVRIFELSASEKKNEDSRRSIRRFVSNMNQYFQNVTKTKILQGFQHWKIEGMKELNNTEYIGEGELERLTENIHMAGIVSLDMSSRLPIKLSYRTLHRAISFMVPNLQQLDLSHTMMSASIIREFTFRCPRLEIIRWNHYDRHPEYNNAIEVDGYGLQSMNNLKELYFDNHYFGFDDDHLIDEDENFAYDNGNDDANGVSEIEAMSNSNNYPNIFLFHSLSDKPLERISIRNAQYEDPEYVKRTYKAIPQNILIKFVRKAPSSLLWFRSDLSLENIRILQSERPGIQLVN